MLSYKKQITEVLNVTTICSATGFSWFGRGEGRLPRDINRKIDDQISRIHLLNQLHQRLYVSFYACGSPTPELNDKPSAVGGDSDFVSQLSRANAGQGGFISGWQVQDIHDDQVVVHRRELTVIAPKDHCRREFKGQLALGDQIDVRFPNEQLGISPGFYMAVGDAYYQDDGDEPRARIYWHITPKGAVPLMSRLTSRLNELALPFQFKVLNDPEQFTRCDSAVLYLRKSGYGRARSAISDIYHEVACWLKPGVPAFTKRLSPGIGLAEDPNDGGSFGWNRCRVLADGILQAREQGARSLSERYDVVSRCFAEAQLDIEQPFLNPGSQDVYLFDATPSQDPNPTSITDPTPRPAGSAAIDRSACLRTSIAIAEQIAKTALWHEGRCTWMARLPEDRHSSAGTQDTYEVLGPTLYSGAAGVALFLAEVDFAAGENRFRKSARGAMLQALARIEEIAASHRLGLHSGWLGVALAAARTGKLLAEQELVDAARQLTFSAVQHDPSKIEFDVLCGLAGGVLSLNVLADLLDEPLYVDFAVEMGDSLVRLAETSPNGSSWRAPNQDKRQRNLTGYSHGTAGAGHALAELYAITGDDKYKRTSEQAFAYERHTFDSEVGNWPDFRRDEDQPRTRSVGKRFMCAWCHGAPGIALSRLRAYQLLGDSSYRDEAITALRTTEGSIRKWLATGISEMGLCHGLCGNTEILLRGREVFSGESVADNSLVDEAAYAVMRWYDGDHRPNDERVAQNGPDLMLGLAGVGHFLLRVSHPHIPSVLVVHPQEYPQGRHPETVPTSILSTDIVADPLLKKPR